jgi:flavin reductase (DIM6/NTAB) family NADH-FMN oxidoreductase RutF
MPILRQIRRVIRKLVLGDTDLPQEFTIGLTEPQTLTTVWLHGLGTPFDVTQNYTTACCAPFLIGIALDSERATKLSAIRSKTGSEYPRPSLQFREQLGEKRLLGQIYLAPVESVPFANSTLLLCHVRGASNYCLPLVPRWAHYFRHGWAEWRRVDTLGFRMSFLELRAAMVTFIRPHPLALVSVSGPEGGNIFPMNLMGELGPGYFAFALKDSRLAAHLVAHAGYLAISNVPMPLCSTAIAMAINHIRSSVDWSQLPFQVRNSLTLKLPVPVLAPRVKELEVLKVFKLGSHNLFIARILSDERISDSLQVNIIHGFYQFWRCRGDRAALRTSLAAHQLNKQRS